MYLVGNYQDIVAEAYLRHSQEFFFCPNPSYRVMGAAKEEQLVPGVPGLFLKGRVINRIGRPGGIFFV
jgi:hypothetical protein